MEHRLILREVAPETQRWQFEYAHRSAVVLGFYVGCEDCDWCDPTTHETIWDAWNRAPKHPN